MRIVAIAALHRALEYFVVEGLGELSLGLHVAAHAQLRFAGLEPECGCLIWIFSGHIINKGLRPYLLVFEWTRVRAVTIGTTDIITPVLAASEIIVTLFARMTRET